MKLSIIEHNPSALKGFLNNPKWYAYGHRMRKTVSLVEVAPRSKRLPAEAGR
jgi:hypothetical protein